MVGSAQEGGQWPGRGWGGWGGPSTGSGHPSWQGPGKQEEQWAACVGTSVGTSGLGGGAGEQRLGLGHTLTRQLPSLGHGAPSHLPAQGLAAQRHLSWSAWTEWRAGVGGVLGATVMVREGCPLAGGCGSGWRASLLNSSLFKAVGLQQPDLRVQTMVGSRP